MRHLNSSELQELITMWETCYKSEIVKKFPDRNYSALAARMRKLGVKSLFHKNTKATGRILLDNSYKAWYWMGFLLADGHFNKKGRITITLNEKDREHLELLASFVGVNNVKPTKKEGVYISFADKITSDKIKEKFNIDNLKSYSPPVLPEMTDDQFISLLCGYIDGDGCISKQVGGRYTDKNGVTKQYIRNDFLLQVKCHSSWESLLHNFGSRLCEVFGAGEEKSKVRIDKAGYVVWRIYDTSVIKKLRHRGGQLKIPLMKRKWEKVI